MTVQLLNLTAVSLATSEHSGLLIVPKLSSFASGHERLCCSGSLPSPFVSIVTANSGQERYRITKRENNATKVQS